MRDAATDPPQPCPVTYALEVFGDRWTLLVLRDVMLERRYRYRELLAANQGLATNVLSDRLKRLERRGLVSKTRDGADARQFIYGPTERAIGLVPMLVEMIVWSAGQGRAQVARTFLDRFEQDRAGLIKELQERIRREAGLG